MPDDRFATGMKVRRGVLGDAHVDASNERTTPFDADFQRFITEGAWGSVWARPGLGRAAADLECGLWWFETVKPCRVPGRDGAVMAPHVNVALFARGINLHLNTRIYFADEIEANAADPVLRLIEQPARRETLLARAERRDGSTVYRLDIRLQGENETVFFDV